MRLEFLLSLLEITECGVKYISLLTAKGYLGLFMRNFVKPVPQNVNILA